MARTIILIRTVVVFTALPGTYILVELTNTVAVAHHHLAYNSIPKASFMLRVITCVIFHKKHQRKPTCKKWLPTHNHLLSRGVKMDDGSDERETYKSTLITKVDFRRTVLRTKNTLQHNRRNSAATQALKKKSYTFDLIKVRGK